MMVKIRQKTDASALEFSASIGYSHIQDEEHYNEVAVKGSSVLEGNNYITEFQVVFVWYPLQGVQNEDSF